MLFSILLLSFLSLTQSNMNEKDIDYEILLHLKPQLTQTLDNYYNILHDFNNNLDEYINQNNFTPYYNYLVSYPLNNSQLAYWPLSVFYNWGLGVEYDPRIALININFGVLTDEFFSILSNFHKTLNGINTISSCESVIPNMKPYLYQLVNNFSLFEQTENEKLTVNSPLHDKLNQDSLENIISDLDELMSTSQSAFSKFFRKYFSAFINSNKTTTKKIYAYLEHLYNSKQSYEAAAYLGFLNIENGGAFETNYEMALSYLNIANKYNIPYSNLVLGVVYFYGLGTTIDYPISIKYFKKAFEQGLVEATTYLGIIYLSGLGVAPDSHIALKYIMLGTTKKYLLSIYTLAMMHEYGLGVFHSCDFASQLYNVIIEQKLLSSIIISAIKDYYEKKPAKSFYKFLSLADLGSSTSMINAAYILEKEPFNFYTQEDRNKHLFRLWNYASKQGIVEATLKVGDAYYIGKGVEQDYTQALASYRHAMNTYSNAHAIFNVAFMHEQGLGIEQNYIAAERYYDMVLATDSDSFFIVSLALLRLRLKMQLVSLKNLVDFYFYIMNESYNFTKRVILQDFDIFFLFLFTVAILFVTRSFYTRYAL